MNIKAVFVIVLLLQSVAHAQDNAADSLESLLQKQKADTNKVKTYFELIKIKRLYDYAAAMNLAQEQLSLSEKLRYHWGAGKAHNSMGLIHYTLSHQDSAVWHYMQAAEEFKKINDYGSLPGVYSNIATIYSDLNQYDSSIYFSAIADNYNEKFTGDSSKKVSNKMFILSNITTNYFHKHEYDSTLLYNDQVMKMAAALGNDKVLADCYYQAALVNLAMKKYPGAVEYSLKALPLYEQEKMLHSIVQLKSGLATIYYSMGDYNLTRKYAAESNETGLQQNDSFSLAQNYMNLGLVELGTGNYTKATAYFEDGLTVTEKIENPFIREQLLQFMGENFVKLKKYDRAIYFLKQAANYSGNNKTKFECYKMLAECYEEKHDYKQALSWYIQFHELEKKVFDSAKARTVDELLIKYEAEKKAAEIKLLQKDNEVKTAYVLKERQTRNYAFAGSAAILAIGFFSYYRYRQKKKTEAEQAMTKERLRISRELHDDVGSTLSGIAMYSHIAQSQADANQPIEVKKSLNIMQQSAGEMVNKLNDIVWLVNPDQDSLQKLVQRLEEYARDMAAIKNMQVTVHIPEHLQEHSLPVESRRNIYLFCKEAINNAVKYSNGTLLDLNIKEVDNKLEFSVSDNGKGFDAVMVRRGNGLENMQKRADEIGAKLTVQSKQDEGSLLSMQIKIT